MKSSKKTKKKRKAKEHFNILNPTHHHTSPLIPSLTPQPQGSAFSICLLSSYNPNPPMKFSTTNHASTIPLQLYRTLWEYGSPLNSNSFLSLSFSGHSSMHLIQRTIEGGSWHRTNMDFYLFFELLSGTDGREFTIRNFHI